MKTVRTYSIESFHLILDLLSRLRNFQHEKSKYFLKVEVLEFLTCIVNVIKQCDRLANLLKTLFHSYDIFNERFVNWCNTSLLNQDSCFAFFIHQKTNYIYGFYIGLNPIKNEIFIHMKYKAALY